VEKLILQTSVLNGSPLISQIAEFSGSQSVSVSIDAIRGKAGEYLVYHAATKKILDTPLRELVKRLESQGAGELIITSVDNEGSMQGYDLNLIQFVRNVTNVPIVANGGAGRISDFQSAILAGADAVAAGSLFVFYSPRKGVLISYPRYEELHEFVGAKNG
jgi:cyclase